MRTILHLISDILTLFATIIICAAIIMSICGIFLTVNWDGVCFLFSIGAILLAIGHTIYYFLTKK